MIHSQSKVDKNIICYHCGDECDDNNISIEDKFFCCNGCKTVYEILSEKNLCDYYQISENPGIKLDKPSAIRNFDFLDDEGAVEKLIDFKSENLIRVTLTIPAMHCSSCIWLLESLSSFDNGIVLSRVDFIKKTLSVSFNPQITSLKKIAILLTSIGYEPQLSFADLEIKKVSSSYKSLLIKLGIAGFAFGNIMLLSFPEYLSVDPNEIELRKIFSWIIFVLSLPVFFYSSSEYFLSAYKGIRKKIINIDFPLTLGILALYFKSVFDIFTGNGPGYMDSFSGLIFFLLIGKYFQNKTFDFLNFDRNYKSYFPIAVSIIRDGKEKNSSLSDLKVGDRIVIHNGELIPADSVLMLGEGNIDYSFVTGESIPISKVQGELIYAGGRQIGSAIELEVVKDVSQSYLTSLWNNASLKGREESRISSLANTISKYFTFAILTIAFASFIFWLNVDSSIAVSVFTAVLIVACPCALALSTPFTLGNTLRIFSRSNFFLKNTFVVEKLSKITSIVFDKTGTLTESHKSLIRYEGESLNSEELGYIYSIAKQSSHPLSKALANRLQNELLFAVRNFEEKSGQGAVGFVQGNEIKIGSFEFVKNETTSMINHKGSKIAISINGIYKGTFSVVGSLRDQVLEMLTLLKNKYDLWVISGDNDSDKKMFSSVISNEEKLLFNQSPHDKLNKILELQKSDKVLMIGDGLNDSGALASSDVGIALTEDISKFTPASDAIIKAEMLNKLPDFLRFSKTSINIIKFNFGLSTLYNIVGISVAVQGLLSPLFAAILMPLSSITVVSIATLATNLIAKKRGLK